MQDLSHQASDKHLETMPASEAPTKTRAQTRKLLKHATLKL